MDAGPDITCPKRHGVWKSNSVAEGYIEESINDKKDIARKILSPDPSTSNAPSVRIDSFPIDKETLSSASAVANVEQMEPASSYEESADIPSHPLPSYCSSIPIFGINDECRSH